MYPLIQEQISEQLLVSAGDAELIYMPAIGVRPWSVQISSIGLNGAVSVTLLVSNDGFNFVTLSNDLQGSLDVDTTSIILEGGAITCKYFKIAITVTTATAGILLAYSML
jgi:hypothetical protein